jgi:hypothetical protein
MYRWSLVVTVFSLVSSQPQAQAASWGDSLQQGSKVVGYIVRVIQIKETFEDLTTQAHKARVEAMLGAARTAAKLEVLSYQGEVTVTESDSNRWFGNNRVKVSVPCTFRYTVDLAHLPSNQLRYDPSTQTVTIVLPPVQLEEPIPDREALKVTERVNPWLRSKKSWTRLQDKALAEKLKPIAQEKGKEGLDEAAVAARTALQSFFMKAYSPLGVEVRVLSR